MAPPLPFLPPEHFGKPVVMVALAYMGDPGAGAKALEPVHTVDKPTVDAVRPAPYLFLQSMFDAGAPAGFHYYLKANLLRELPDEVIDGFVGQVGSITSHFSQIRLHWIRGVASRPVVAVESGSIRWMTSPGAHEVDVKACEVGP